MVVRRTLVRNKEGEVLAKRGKTHPFMDRVSVVVEVMTKSHGSWLQIQIRDYLLYLGWNLFFRRRCPMPTTPITDYYLNSVCTICYII